MSTVYFISGANRGIGFSFVKQLSERSDVKVIATTRNIKASTDLLELQKKNKNVEIVEVDVSSEESIKGVDAQLKKVAPEGIDVFISNAGISNAFYTVKDAPSDVWLTHHKTNVLGPIFLYQALYPYLEKRKTKQIVFVSSAAGSIGGFFPNSLSAYGQSKAALNYSVREIAFELQPEGFTVIAVHPGFVSSDMGRAGLELVEAQIKDEDFLKQVKSSIITPDESAASLLKIVDGLTKESTSKFFNYDGTDFPW